MKKTTLAIAMVTVAILILVSVSFSIKTVQAQNVGNFYTINYELKKTKNQSL